MILYVTVVVFVHTLHSNYATPKLRYTQIGSLTLFPHRNDIQEVIRYRAMKIV